ncbi:post-segregation antitoxin CcdA [uncultured Sphingomonas sp.]|uniref:post-segregation antitoxin CcdA n=1 Tax=uncultured Sphingomonas sp. TaxID=158754 RepID=UPI0035CB91B9
MGKNCTAAPFFVAHHPCAWPSIIKHYRSATGKRKRVNPRLDIGIGAAGRNAGLNPSQISKIALRAAAKKVPAAQRQEGDGLPLARYRRF